MIGGARRVVQGGVRWAWKSGSKLMNKGVSDPRTRERVGGRCCWKGEKRNIVSKAKMLLR